MVTSKNISSTKRCQTCQRKEDKLKELLEDPYYNVALRLPDSDIVIERIRNDEILQAYFRPDKSPNRQHYWFNRPSQEEVDNALKNTLDGLHADTIWRTARDEGVFWLNNRENPLETLRELALVIYSRDGTFLRKE